jgi:hypothetical protein
MHFENLGSARDNSGSLYRWSASILVWRLVSSVSQVSSFRFYAISEGIHPLSIDGFRPAQSPSPWPAATGWSNESRRDRDMRHVTIVLVTSSPSFVLCPRFSSACAAIWQLKNRGRRTTRRRTIEKSPQKTPALSRPGSHVTLRVDSMCLLTPAKSSGVSTSTAPSDQSITSTRSASWGTRLRAP